MRLVATRPVTIERSLHGHRWFPSMRRLRDGSLLIHVQTGHDLAFSPVIRLRSFDNGAQWQPEPSAVPRCGWCWQFDDGELFEMDNYGTSSEASPRDAVALAAWSRPETRDGAMRLGTARLIDAPARLTPLSQWINGNPTMPWWGLWADLLGERAFTPAMFDRVRFNGLFFTDGLELSPGRLVAVAYGKPPELPPEASSHASPARWTTWLVESADRGTTWRVRGRITADAPDAVGTNEAALARLDDGRLYSVLRTDGTGAHPLVHAWSSDDGRTWSTPKPLQLLDEPAHTPASVWPRLMRCGKALVLAYGRPGKHLVIDPAGDGTHWQARLDLHELALDTQARMGVPPAQRLRGVVGHMLDAFLDRYHDSGDYLALAPLGDTSLLVVHDVQGFVEHWNDRPHSALRMMRVDLVD